AAGQLDDVQHHRDDRGLAAESREGRADPQLREGAAGAEGAQVEEGGAGGRGHSRSIGGDLAGHGTCSRARPAPPPTSRAPAALHGTGTGALSARSTPPVAQACRSWSSSPSRIAAASVGVTGRRGMSVAWKAW